MQRFKIRTRYIETDCQHNCHQLNYLRAIQGRTEKRFFSKNLVAGIALKNYIPYKLFFAMMSLNSINSIWHMKYFYPHFINDLIKTFVLEKTLI